MGASIRLSAIRRVTGKLDWNATKDIHVFYRFSYNWNISESNFGYDYSVYSSKNNAPAQAAGLDWGKGSWSHSFRFGYLKFHNQIAGATTSFNPVPSGEIGALDTGEIISGPNLLAPQGTLQTNKQIKYDGSKVWRAHIFRFGVGVNRILGGGFASFFGLAPLDYTLSNSNPNVPLQDNLLYLALIGNGQGFFTEKPAFGYPGGGQADTRFQWYVGDSWKLKPNFTLSYGLRYNRDTGRSDSDLGTDTLLCGEIQIFLRQASPVALAICSICGEPGWVIESGIRTITTGLRLDSRGILRRMARPSFAAEPVCITRTTSLTTLCLTVRISWRRDCFSVSVS